MTKARTVRTMLASLLVFAVGQSAVAAGGQGGGVITVHHGGSTTIDRAGRVVHRGGMAMVEGSGRYVRAARTAGPFEAIELEGPANLEVTVGAVPSIEVEADDNILRFLTTESADGVLRIGTRGAFRIRRAPTVRVTMAALSRLRAHGAGDVRVSGVAGDGLALDLQGSGDMIAAGRAGRVRADLHGTGRIDLSRLASPDYTVNLHGTGDIRVHADGALRATVHGTGRIAYSGRATPLSEEVYGPGEIRRVGR